MYRRTTLKCKQPNGIRWNHLFYTSLNWMQAISTIIKVLLQMKMMILASQSATVFNIFFWYKNCGVTYFGPVLGRW